MTFQIYDIVGDQMRDCTKEDYDRAYVDALCFHAIRKIYTNKETETEVSDGVQYVINCWKNLPPEKIPQALSDILI